MSAQKHIPELALNCVHVWRTSTVVDDRCFGALAKILSPEEIMQADRFHFERDRRSFIVCRGTLRRLLAFYAHEDAADIRFRHGSSGKPSLVNLPELQFNLSHSNGIALFAFALQQEIGVDVEFMRPGIDFAGLAQHSFSKSERAAVFACIPQDRGNIFYRYWTCKEACIKADGRGMSIPLEEFSITPLEGEPQWRGIVSHRSIGLVPGMRVRLLEVGDGYAAAIAGSGPSWEVLELDLHSSSDEKPIREPWGPNPLFAGARSTCGELPPSPATLDLSRDWGKG